MTRPIFHLSIPVRDLDQAVAFYEDVLGAGVGRRTETYVDVRLFGAQLTLQNGPMDVPAETSRTRHFGATIAWADWERLAAALSALAIEGPTVSFAGERHEQAKLMIADPSGNLIELKAYRDPVHVLGDIAIF